MRAVTITPAGELRWAEHPDPAPGDTQLLVSVRAAGVNAADLVQRQGFYPAPPGWPPDIPGMELAGEVVSTGSRVTRFKPGDRVMGLVGGGAQAELAVIHESSAMEVPPGTSWQDAGGFAETYSTAYDALFTQCGLTLGDKLLVTGAAGGVGTAAVQLGAVVGARVTASVRRAELRDSVMALGAAEALDPEAALGSGPFDVALELIGGPSFPAVLQSMATGGRIVVIGMGGGSTAEINLFAVMHNRVRISGSTLRARPEVDKALVARPVEANVVPHFAAGRLRVPIVDTFDMSDATAAYERFAEGGKLGKIVLVN